MNTTNSVGSGRHHDLVIALGKHVKIQIDDKSKEKYVRIKIDDKPKNEHKHPLFIQMYNNTSAIIFVIGELITVSLWDGRRAHLPLGCLS
jgi:hypothetical protein